MTKPYIVQTKWRKLNGIFGSFVQNHKVKNIGLVSEKCNQTFGSNHRFRSNNVFNKRIFCSKQAILNHMKYIPGAYAQPGWVCTFHDGCKQGIDQQIFNRKSISLKITHPQSWKLQANLQVKSWKA